MLPYDDRFDESTNLERAAAHFEHQARTLDSLPSRAGEVEDLRLRASAARDGALLFDHTDIRGCDPVIQRWRVKLAPLGMLVRADQYRPDGKAPERAAIRVERGLKPGEKISTVWR